MNRESLRTLQVLPSLDPLDGGVPTAAVHANIAKQRAGIETTVAFVDKGNTSEMREQLSLAGMRTLGFPVVPRTRLMARWSVSPQLAFWLMRHLRAFDLIHVDGAWGLPGIVTVLLARVARRPVVLTPHASLTDFDVKAAPTAVRRVAKVVLKRYYLRFASLIVFSSELERADSVLGRSVRTAVVPNAVVDDRALTPVKSRPTGERRIVGFLGRLHPTKNVDVLIRALAMLPDNVRLVVGGEGSPDFTEDLRLLARALGVSDRIDWRGFLEPSERERFFADIDVLAMPSAYECFGMVGAEALVASVPVVVSDRTGLAEIVGSHGGGLVCRPTAEALANSLVALLDDARLRACAEEAGRAARSTVSYSAYGNSLRASYEALILN